MKIRKAEMKDIENVKDITYRTIKAVYLHYYPIGAVEFFLKHHREDNIIRDIKDGAVFLAEEKDTVVGTVTINENEINRLFVLPDFQGKGFGRGLMEFAEKRIAEKYKTAVLSASLSAKQKYLKNGYVETDYNIIECEGGDKLCFDNMCKNL